MKIKSSIDTSEGSANLGEAMKRPSDEISKVSGFSCNVSTSARFYIEQRQQRKCVGGVDRCALLGRYRFR